MARGKEVRNEKMRPRHVCIKKRRVSFLMLKKVKKGGFNQMVVQKEEEGVTLLGNSQDKETRYIPHGNQQYKTEDVQNLGSLKKRLNNLHSTHILLHTNLLKEKLLIKYTLRNK